MVNSRWADYSRFSGVLACSRLWDSIVERERKKRAGCSPIFSFAPDYLRACNRLWSTYLFV